MSDAPLGVIDIGSNTVRLLVAQLDDGGLRQIRDESVFVRLGQGVDRTGRLSPERTEMAVEAVDHLARQARQLGVRRLQAIATSAVRDAANGQEFVRQIEEHSGVSVRVLSGSQEAALTFLGATYGLALEEPALVADLGGGSLELIAANPESVVWDRSLQLGASRMTERYVQHDPPLGDDLAEVAFAVTEELARLPPDEPCQGIYTGGTATHVAILLDRAGSWPVRISRDDLEQARDIAVSAPAADIAQRYTIKLERAQVLPAGIQVLVTVAQYFDIDQLTITQHGIREGVLLAEVDG